ncbi:hypothetical protein ACFL5V_09970 [Fibrobacterota bacterium]
MSKLKKTMIPVAVLFFLPQAGLYADMDIYGYMSLYYENVGAEKDGVMPLAGDKLNGAGDKGDEGEFDLANFNLMMQSQITNNIRVFLNVKGTGDLQLNNYWGEYSFYRDYVKLRTGNIYRPFGQFNELLDAVPSYLGMEPPELFDKDHLMLPRTGKIMLHGSAGMGEDHLRYAYMLDSDENWKASNNDELTLSHSVDVNYTFRDMLTAGTSAFFANEQNGPATGIGDGSPRTGVLPWMASDTYNVFGGYLRAKVKGLTVKAAYWIANHDAQRDTGKVAQVYANAALNSAQLNNFFNDGSYSSTVDVGSDVVTKAEFAVSTYYLRLGYTIPRGLIKVMFLKNLELTPYAFWDVYENPETIKDKTWGGDNEAGAADDGVFTKPTIGISIKPSPFVALKIDGSSHIQKIGGEDNHYEEFRMDISYFFK